MDGFHSNRTPAEAVKEIMSKLVMRDGFRISTGMTYVIEDWNNTRFALGEIRETANRLRSTLSDAQCVIVFATVVSKPQCRLDQQPRILSRSSGRNETRHGLTNDKRRTTTDCDMNEDGTITFDWDSKTILVTSLMNHWTDEDFVRALEMGLTELKLEKEDRDWRTEFTVDEFADNWDELFARVEEGEHLTIVHPDGYSVVMMPAEHLHV